MSSLAYDQLVSSFPAIERFPIVYERLYSSIVQGLMDDSLDSGRSARCETFGNEPLSDEGEKFGVLGVELWVMG